MMAVGNLRAFLVFLLVQVCLFLMMTSSAKVQGRHLMNLESTPECCLYHPDCCEPGSAGPAAAAIP
jgi:hypothetical protein